MIILYYYHDNNGDNQGSKIVDLRKIKIFTFQIKNRGVFLLFLEVQTWFPRTLPFLLAEQTNCYDYYENNCISQWVWQQSKRLIV